MLSITANRAMSSTKNSSVAPMTRFRFLRLPLLIKVEVLKWMTPMDLFEFSLTSRKTADVIAECLLNAEMDIHCEGEFIRVTVTSGERQVTHCDFFDYMYKGKRVPREFDNHCFGGCYKTVVSFGFTNGFNQVFHRLLSLYSNVKLRNVKIIENDCDPENLSIAESLRQLQLKKSLRYTNRVFCDNLELGTSTPEVPMRRYTTDAVLSILCATESVRILDSLEHCHEAMLQASLLHITHDFPAWPIGSVPCEQILVEESGTVDARLNDLLHRWRVSWKNLKVMEFRNVIGEDLEALCSQLSIEEPDFEKHGEEFKVPGTERTIDCRDGKDIRREDEVVGTIVRRQSYFAFVVWK